MTGTAGERAGDVVICRRDDGVVAAQLDRPRVINALDDAMAAGLERAVDVAHSTGAKALVLRGSGGNFCAGADLRYVARLVALGGRHLVDFIARLRNVCTSLADGPFVSIALVEGHAMAGGFEILAACDLAVARDDARISDRHLEQGLSPGIGVSVRIGHLLGAKRARWLALTGDVVSGTEAAAWGIVSHAWNASDFDRRADELVARIATRNRAALVNYKRMLNAAERLGRDAAMTFEAESFEAYVGDPGEWRDSLSRFNRP